MHAVSVHVGSEIYQKQSTWLDKIPYGWARRYNMPNGHNYNYVQLASHSNAQAGDIIPYLEYAVLEFWRQLGGAVKLAKKYSQI